MKPPGLMMMPSTWPRAAWMRSIRAPSWLDWKASSVAFMEAAWALHEVSMSERVVWP